MLNRCALWTGTEHSAYSVVMRPAQGKKKKTRQNLVRRHPEVRAAHQSDAGLKLRVMLA